MPLFLSVLGPLSNLQWDLIHLSQSLMIVILEISGASRSTPLVIMRFTTLA